MAGMEIASLYAKIGADAGEFNKAMRGVKDDLSANEKGFASFEKVAVAGLKAVGAAAVAAFAALGAAVGASIKAAADFEQGIADVGAVMNLTADETAKLEDHIMDLGLSPDLKVSATEAQDAIMSLGTAGLSMKEIMGGASEATVALSNSTGGQMADAATLVTDIMSQFNITAGETGRIVDQVTGLTVASKFGFNDAALAMAQAGGVAGSTGLNFEDFNAILGVTAANFSSGSDAGTSLKTFLTTLVPKSAEAADEMRKLGLFTGLTGKEFDDTQAKIAKLREKITELDPTSKNYSDRVNELNGDINELRATLVEGGSAFFDANGNMRDAEGIAAALQEAFGGLSEAQRIEAASTIFGNDAMRTAFGLIDAGTPGITKMKEEIAATNAGDIAAKRMDTFSGAIEIAMGVIETLSISIGQKFLPILRPLVEEFSRLAQVHGPKLVGFFETLAAKMGDNIQKSMQWAGEVLPPLWERLTQIGTVLKTVGASVMNAIKPVTDAITKWISWKDILGAVALLLTGAVIAAIGSFLAAMAPVVLLVTKVALGIANMRNIWESNFLGIRDITETVLDRIAKWIDTYLGLWRGDWGTTLKYITKNSDEAWRHISGKVIDSYNYWTNETRHAVSVWVDAILNKIEYYVVNTKMRLHVWWGWVQKYFNDAKDLIANWYENTLGKFIPDEWERKGRDIIQGLWDGLRNVWNRLSSWFTGVWGDLTNRFKNFFGIHSPSTLFASFGSDMMAGLADGIEGSLSLVTDAMGKVEAMVTKASPTDALEKVLGTDSASDFLRKMNDLGEDARTALEQGNVASGHVAYVFADMAASATGAESISRIQAIINELGKHMGNLGVGTSGVGGTTRTGLTSLSDSLTPLLSGGTYTPPPDPLPISGSGTGTSDPLLYDLLRALITAVNNGGRITQDGLYDVVQAIDRSAPGIAGSNAYANGARGY